MGKATDVGERQHRHMEDVECREVVELVTAYLENVLPQEERDLVEQHLLTCGACEAYIGQMRRTIDLVGRVEVGGLSQEAQDDLLAAFRGWAGKRPT
jgi:anti-sigma factor RsiW